MCVKSYVKNGSSSSLVQQNGNLRSDDSLYMFIWKRGDFMFDYQMCMHYVFGEDVV